MPPIFRLIFLNSLAISENLALKKMIGIFFRFDGSSGPMCDQMFKKCPDCINTICGGMILFHCEKCHVELF